MMHLEKHRVIHVRTEHPTWHKGCYMYTSNSHVCKNPFPPHTFQWILNLKFHLMRVMVWGASNKVLFCNRHRACCTHVALPSSLFNYQLFALPCSLGQHWFRQWPDRVSSHEPSQNSLTFPWHFPDHCVVFPDHYTYYRHFITALTLILQAIWQITHQKWPLRNNIN